MKCDAPGCNAVLDPNTVHIFETPIGEHVATFCDDHCDRCWAGRREATMDKHIRLQQMNGKP